MLFENHRFVSLPQATYARFILNETECNGCGRCVKTCPIQLLMIENEKARPNHRYDDFRCITCQNCVSVCPQNAIIIDGDYRVEKGFWKNTDVFRGSKTLPNPFMFNDKKLFEEYEKDLTETEKVIYKRRSIRLYKKKQLPKDLVHRVIEAGRFAPSAGNNQPWKYIVIQNKGLISEINRKCKKFIKLIMRGTMPDAWLEKQTPGDKNAKLKKWQTVATNLLVKWRAGDLDPRARGGMNTVTSDPNYDIFLGAPTLIIILADKRGIGSIELDTGICAQNMILAAHSLGLGTCYIGLIDGLMMYPGFRKSIGIKHPFEIITSFTLGYPQGQIDNIVKREQARVNWID